jgi:hypothetical protein
MGQKSRVRWLAVLTVLLAGCPAPRRYAVEQQGMPCERGTRLAYETMQQLGYTVTEAVEATRAAPGRVVGTKARPDGSVDRGVVRVTCTPSGVTFQPVEGDLVPTYEFSRGFGYSSTALAKLPASEQTAPSGRLEVSIEAIDVPRANLDLGGWPMATEDVLIRVRVRNGADRPVVIEPSSIDLLAASGEPVAALDGPALAASLGTGRPADSVRSRLLSRTRVEPGTKVERFLVFPPGQYGEAQVALEDVETGESDGFQVPVR